MKLENLQITNSFKIRGALNRILQLSEEEVKRGIITASAGNHAQAIAIGAEKKNLVPKIIVPRNTPKVKIEKIKEHKVELVLYGETYDEAEEFAINLAKKAQLTYISPYNDELIVAGQGTIGLEILEDLPSAQIVLVGVGGGGLISGISVAVRTLRPNVRILGVESEASPGMLESLKAGRIVDVELKDSIAEGLAGNIEQGSITFEIIQRYVDEILLIKEDTIRKAVYLLWQNDKQMTEGAGAAAIGPILENKGRFIDKTTVAVISGGNIEDTLFRSILASETQKAQSGN